MATRKNQASANKKPEPTEDQQSPEQEQPQATEDQQNSEEQTSGADGQGENAAGNSEEPQPSPRQETKRKTVTFFKPYGRYSRGDTAGFEPEEADRLVKKKVVVEGTKLPQSTDDQGNEPKA